MTIENTLAAHRFIPFDSKAALEQALAASIAANLSQALETHGRASIAVSGGSTPKALFALLSQTELNWAAIDITLVDERWVEVDSDQSNQKMLAECLLINRAKAARFIGMKSKAADVNGGVSDYNAKLANDIKQPFDVVILGMGPDGHTASWFPDAAETPAALDPQASSASIATHPASQPMPRITLSFPPVAAAGQIYLHITGEDKKQVLEHGLADGNGIDNDNDNAIALPIHQTLAQLTRAVDIYWAA